MVRRLLVLVSALALLLGVLQAPGLAARPSYGNNQSVTLQEPVNACWKSNVLAPVHNAGSSTKKIRVKLTQGYEAIYSSEFIVEAGNWAYPEFAGIKGSYTLLLQIWNGKKFVDDDRVASKLICTIKVGAKKVGDTLVLTIVNNGTAYADVLSDLYKPRRESEADYPSPGSWTTRTYVIGANGTPYKVKVKVDGTALEWTFSGKW